MRGRRGHGRALALGNLLIIIGVALFGMMVTVAPTGHLSEGVVLPVSAGGVAAAPQALASMPTSAPAPAPAPATATDTATVTATPAAAKLAQSATPSVTAAAATPSAALAAVVPTPTSAPTPAPTAAPTPKPPLPPANHISIPAVGIDTKVVEVGYDVVTIDGQQVLQSQVADYAAGHDSSSANPGQGGNIVISGHDDWRGEVFRTLEKVKVGDDVVLTTPQRAYHYTITEIEYRKEIGVPLSERLATGQFLAPMPEERVTLVTCWPYGVDDHRIIVIAKPAG